MTYIVLDGVYSGKTNVAFIIYSNLENEIGTLKQYSLSKVRLDRLSPQESFYLGNRGRLNIQLATREIRQPFVGKNIVMLSRYFVAFAKRH